jgi:hypothetical protein
MSPLSLKPLLSARLRDGTTRESNRERWSEDDNDAIRLRKKGEGTGAMWTWGKKRLCERNGEEGEVLFSTRLRNEEEY